MTEKRRLTTGHIKKGLKKTMMLLLALTFVLSTMSMMVPVASASFTRTITNHNGGGSGGNFGSWQAGYQVMAWGAHTAPTTPTGVRPIRVQVTNNVNTPQTANISISGADAGAFELNTRTLTNIPANGGSLFFEVRPLEGLATRANDYIAQLNISISGEPIQTIALSITVTQGFVLDGDIVIPFGAFRGGEVNVAPAGQPAVWQLPATLIEDITVLDAPAGNPQDVDGTFRWATAPTTPLGQGHHSREVIFTPTNLAANSIIRWVVSVIVVPAPINSIVAPTPSPIRLGQTLGQSVLSGGTQGGTWTWDNGLGVDYSQHRPNRLWPAPGGTFHMRFTPHDPANFVGHPTSHVVTQNLVVNRALVNLRATNITVYVGDRVPTLANIQTRFTHDPLLPGDSFTQRPTLALAAGAPQPNAIANTVGTWTITLTGGAITNPGNYEIVRHNATLRVVARPAPPPPAGQGAWVQVGTDWYFRNAAGQNLTGWHLVDGSWFFMHTEATRGTLPLGVMARGWLNDAGTWYYLRSNGAMARGWVQTGGVWYYLGEGGAMVTNGWALSGGSWYYLGGNGAMVANQWVSWNGNYYWLRADGRMVTGVHTIAGVRQRFAADGRWLGRA
ncbi:MAG: hypothetical protein FWC20_09750 [Oscillospiraceae bacterium]|nr:hypothetical protein [Oscillospiraceae bacterium]MCL2279670.1 hypothetical protein [Oscillospiraceae bacterium]